MKAITRPYAAFKRATALRREFGFARQQWLSSTQITEEEKALISKVSLRIHNRDTMYSEKKAHEYIYIGLSAIQCIQQALLNSQATHGVHNILDFPCGYGRVLRFLRAKYPNSKIVASDIEVPALDFCRRSFSADTVISKTDFRDLSLGQQFDLIWCGSLFTHITEQATCDLLQFFHRHLSPGGVCVFTTHGQRSIEWIQRKAQTYGLSEQSQQAIIRGVQDAGYGYVDYAQEAGYGISLVSSQRMRELARKTGEWQEVLYLDHGWAQHQDVYAFARPELA